MSLVGTRPPLISETNLYELHHKARLAIKPGITGILFKIDIVGFGCFAWSEENAEELASEYDN